MSFDKMLREMVRDEVERAMAPLKTAIAQQQANGAVIARLAAALGQPIKAGVVRAVKGGGAGRSAAGEKRACALQGCGRPARSKGYCAAHYQKYRMLDRTGRLPPDWIADAAPGSVKNLKLPRGRAGAKALAEARKK